MPDTSMLSTPFTHHNQANIFLPTTPSPLSPRSANIYGPYRTNGWMSDPTTKNEQSPNLRSTGKENDTRRRQNVKKAPSPKQDDLKERRRSMFLRNVRENREDKRFEARGEDIMRLDYLQRRRAWEAQLANEAKAYAPEVERIEEEEEHDLPAVHAGSDGAMEISTSQRAPEEEVDEVMQREDEELEAMVEMMEQEERRGNGVGQSREMELWSDDDDYEQLFSEVMGMETGQSTEQDGGGGGSSVTDVDMDMS